MINAIKATLTLIAVATVALAGTANAGTAPHRVVTTPSLPKLNINTHPNVPKICLNPLDKGPGARKCG